MVQVHSLDPYKVSEIRVLEGKPESSKALEMLEAVARQVQPILRRRKFTVPLLKEFFPRNSRLLGLNVGGGGGGTREICIRLRPAGREADFLPYESVLGTMLHEITHNMVGPHNASFYKLLDELTQECEELMAKGISGTGAGFDAPAAGKPGGRFVGRDLPAHRVRELALQAAEARRRRQGLLPSGPRTAGGDLSLRHLPPREAAAAAAERRLRDNVWCPTEVASQEEAAGHDVDAALQAILNNAQPQPAAAAATRQSAGGPQHETMRSQRPQQQQSVAYGLAQSSGSRAASAAAAAALAAPLRPSVEPAAGRGIHQRPAGALAGTDSASGRAATAGRPGEPAAAVQGGAASLGRDSSGPATVGASVSQQTASRQPSSGGEAGGVLPNALEPQGAPQQQVTRLGEQRSQAEEQQQLWQQRRAPGGGEEVVDLTVGSDDDEGAGAALPARRAVQAHVEADAEVQQQDAGKPSKRASVQWVCPACTLVNKPLALQCEACLGLRPAGWV